MSAPIEIPEDFIGSPSKLTPEDVATCLSILKEGEAVNLESAKTELPRAALVFVRRIGGEIVAVGAIKRVRLEYAKSVAVKAGADFDPNVHELGYVAVRRTHSGRGYSHTIVRGLLAAFPSRPLFATTSNERMRATLGKAGFRRIGNEWQGESGKLSLWILGKNRGRSAAFFFGSGISRNSGALTVEGITANLLDGAWMSHTDWRFYPRREDEQQVSIGTALRAQEFLRIVKKEIDPHLRAREGREANYEDLFSAVRQIVDDEMAEGTNPLLAGTTASIRAATAHLHEGGDYHIDTNRFASLSDRASDLVQWVVNWGLACATVPVGIQAVSDVAKSVGDLDIFSLNHDLLIEAQLKSTAVQFFDGFGDQRGDARVFNGSWPGDRPAVRLLKLHGSTNWYRFRFGEWDQYAVVDRDVDHAKDEHGNYISLLDPVPRFLTGTTIKEQAYGHDLFGELFFQFRTLLSRHRTLICCGYGWGDKGINIRLDQWLRDAKENRLVILHPDWESEARQKRFWWRRWQPYRDAGNVVIVPKWLKDCSVSDLEPYFG